MANSPKKILIVEDDKFLLKFYANRLKKEGFETILVESGEGALEQLKKVKPNLILLDLILPQKDGFEVLQEIKKDPRTKDIPVLVLSNLGQVSDQEKAKELGAEDYLVKANLDIKDIIDKINQFLK